MRCLIALLKINPHDHYEYLMQLEELEALANTIGYEVADRIVQTHQPRPKYLIGAGKVKEIKNLIQTKGIDLVIFDNFLTSRQVFELEEAWDIDVIDKFDLILNVFEAHATSREAKLQIELARLNRNVPFVKTLLGRRVRAEHPGYGGAGEFIVHSSLTGIRQRISKVSSELDRHEAQKEILRAKRKEVAKIVSLAGYTNSGKSTLLNTLTGEEQLARDELFTTLQTKTSRIKWNGEKILINDTIGFIRKLPHALVSAFRATLSDIRESDLILLVTDFSNPLKEILQKLKVSRATLKEINAESVPLIHVFNKIDRLSTEEIQFKLGELESTVQNPVLISAKYGLNLDELKKKINEALYSS